MVLHTIIDQHSCRLDGVLYRFRLSCAALEPRWAGRRRYLLSVDAFTDSRAVSTRTFHTVVSANASAAEICGLVDDAFRLQVQQPGYPAIVSQQAVPA